MTNRPTGTLHCNDAAYNFGTKTSYDIYLLIYYNWETFPKWLCVDPRTNCVHIR